MLSSDPRKRERQLANLAPRRPPPPEGNRRAVSHGAYARVLTERLEAKAAEVFAAVAADAPVRAQDGSLPAADAVPARLLAECLCRLEDVGSHLRDRGLFDKDGGVRPAVELEGRLRREAADHADALGMTPRSRAKLGLDLAKSFDLAQAWAQEDVAAEALDVDADAVSGSYGPASDDRDDDEGAEHDG